ncbi:MAG: hypothetical protein JO352_09645 [Chloroflexi bacterium]|nr:hypothetical protein [Chloroflexota bacterium]
MRRDRQQMLQARRWVSAQFLDEGFAFGGIGRLSVRDVRHQHDGGIDVISDFVVLVAQLFHAARRVVFGGQLQVPAAAKRVHAAPDCPELCQQPCVFIREAICELPGEFGAKNKYHAAELGAHVRMKLAISPLTLRYTGVSKQCWE